MSWPSSCSPSHTSMMRVALTVWEGRVSPVFDVCREALVLDIENRQVAASSKQPLSCAAPSNKTQLLVDRGVHTLICGAISNELLGELESKGIQVIAFIAGDVESVIAAFAAGDLPNAKFTMPGCPQRPRSCGAGRGRRRRHGLGRDRQ